jgi:hypothetical protein
MTHEAHDISICPAAGRRLKFQIVSIIEAINNMSFTVSKTKTALVVVL